MIFEEKRRCETILNDIEEIFVTACSAGAIARALMVAREVLLRLEKALKSAGADRRSAITERIQKQGFGFAGVAFELGQKTVSRTIVAEIREIAGRLLLQPEAALVAAGRRIADALVYRANVSIGEREGFGAFYCGELFIEQYYALVLQINLKHPEFDGLFVDWRGVLIQLIRAGELEAAARGVTMVSSLIIAAQREAEPLRTKLLTSILGNSNKILRMSLAPMLMKSTDGVLNPPSQAQIRLARHTILAFSVIPDPAAAVRYPEILRDYVSLVTEVTKTNRDLADLCRNTIVSFTCDLIDSRASHPNAILDKDIVAACNLLDIVLQNDDALAHLHNLQLLSRVVCGAVNRKDRAAFTQSILIFAKHFGEIPSAKNTIYLTAVHMIFALAVVSYIGGGPACAKEFTLEIVPPKGISVQADVIMDLLVQMKQLYTAEQVNSALKCLETIAGSV